MSSFSLILKSLTSGLNVGILRRDFDGEKYTVEVTFTSRLIDLGECLVKVFTVDKTLLLEKSLSKNEYSMSFYVYAKRFDVVIFLGDTALCFADIEGVNNLSDYLCAVSCATPYNEPCDTAYDTPCDTPYDDEAIAEENYYLLEENYTATGDKNATRKSDEDDLFNCNFENKKRKNPPKKTGEIYEDDYCQKEGVTPYFKKVEKELCGAISQYRSTQKLSKTLANTQFYEVFEDGKEYLFGVQTIADKPRYFIYAVKKVDDGFLSNKDFLDKGVFLPLSIFDKKEKVWWCVFQDAVTGELVKRE